MFKYLLQLSCTGLVVPVIYWSHTFVTSNVLAQPEYTCFKEPVGHWYMPLKPATKQRSTGYMQMVLAPYQKATDNMLVVPAPNQQATGYILEVISPNEQGNGYVLV